MDNSNKKRCECSNYITEDETQCEWCLNPEAPMYRVSEGEDGEITLYFLGMFGGGVSVQHRDWLNDFWIVAYAPSEILAERMISDYISKEVQ